MGAANGEEVVACMPELYFATVKAIGTDLSVVEEALQAHLSRAGYSTVNVRLSTLFKDCALTAQFLAPADTSAFEQRHGLMTAGDALRSFISPDAVGQLGLMQVEKLRQEKYREAINFGKRGVAFIIKSLMHEREVATLRALLGSQLFIVSAFSRESNRRSHLHLQLEARFKGPYTLDQQVTDLMERDRGKAFRFDDPLRTYIPEDRIERLSIDKTFHEADFFVDVDQPDTVEREIGRFIKHVFGYPYGATTPDETGMAHASTALMQSSCLARRVGAAVVLDGTLVATGRNDVPLSGGGQVTQHPGEELSEAVLAEPGASDDERADVLRDAVVRLLSDKDWIGNIVKRGGRFPTLSSEQVHELAELAAKSGGARESRVFDLIEFNPTVHAEMSAITSAARRGAPLEHATLYTTTFPCHECTRHIISTGIKRVVYLEPYPKSRAEALFNGQIVLGSKEEVDRDAERRVHYEPFIGISARRHGDLFSWVDRKPKSGAAGIWDLNAERQVRDTVEPRLPTSLLRSWYETRVLLQRQLVEIFEETLRTQEKVLAKRPNGPSAGPAQSRPR
jgi:deoxycytidylate deaminase